MQKDKLLGKTGENIAAAYLQSKGYSILERNFRKQYGEIDIVALEDDTYIFVEVKTRTSNTFGFPEEAVTRKKLQEVVKTAELYLTNHTNVSRQYRIDVISVNIDTRDGNGTVKHFKSVTL